MHIPILKKEVPPLVQVVLWIKISAGIILKPQESRGKAQMLPENLPIVSPKRKEIPYIPVLLFSHPDYT